MVAQHFDAILQNHTFDRVMAERLSEYAVQNWRTDVAL